MDEEQNSIHPDIVKPKILDEGDYKSPTKQGKTQPNQQRQLTRRPPPLKIPVRMPMIIEIPDDMIEWHGILLPIEDAESPITPSHWSVRIENPIIADYYNQALIILAFTRKPFARWTDMRPVEFLPNLYLGSYYNIYDFEHSVRVSVLEDFSVLQMGAENTDVNLGGKLEIQAKDDAATDIMSHFDKVRDFLEQQSDDDIKFIHCVAGMNRSATLATAYYIYKTGHPLLQAIQHMVALRPIILQNSNFLKQLVVWAYDNGFATDAQ